MSSARRWTALLLLAGTAAVVQLSCAGVGQNQPVVASSHAPLAVPNTFGMHVFDGKDHWPIVPFGFWRLSNTFWARVETGPGVFDFGVLDEDVALAEKHGVTVIYNLGFTPAWATSQPTSPGLLGPGTNAPPARLADWQQYVQTVAARYQGRIHYYEIWNEPDLAGYWIGTVQQMSELSRAAYTIIKQIDPSAQVLSPAVVDWFKGTQWLNDFSAVGGMSYVDIVAFHLYFVDMVPEHALFVYQNAAKLSLQFGKPLWDTEMGWGPWGNFTDVAAAAFVARTLILQWSVGIDHVFWYAWDDRGWVHLFLVEPDYRTLTPAGQAFAHVQNWLLRSSNMSCASQTDGSWQCSLISSGGARQYIVWNPSTTETFEVPTSWTVTRVDDLLGHTAQITANQIQIGPMPVLLK